MVEMGVAQQDSAYIFKSAIMLGLPNLLPQVACLQVSTVNAFKVGKQPHYQQVEKPGSGSGFQVFFVESAILTIRVAKVQEKLSFMIFQQNFVASDFPDATVERKLDHAVTRTEKRSRQLSYHIHYRNSKQEKAGHNVGSDKHRVFQYTYRNGQDVPGG